MSLPKLTLSGRVEGRVLRHDLGTERILIGRAPDCDVVLPIPSISRHHAEIVQHDGRHLIQDLGSQNGTRVNGVFVAKPTPIMPGDRVALASTELEVLGPADTVSATPTASRPAPMLTMAGGATADGIEISWDEITSLRRDPREKKARLFQVLVEAGELLTRPLSPEDLFEPVLDLVDTALRPERTLLLLRDGDEEVPQIVASRLHGQARSREIVLSKTVVDRVMHEKSAFLIEDIDAAGSLAASQSIVAQGIRTAMAVPLVDEERVMGLLYADTSAHGARYSRDELKAFSILSSVIAMAFTHARFHALEEEQQRLASELEAARGILAEILPAALPETPGYQLEATLEPCFEVGGDLYDLFPLADGRLVVVMGDVSGKGLGAAVLVSTILPMVRVLAETADDPAALVARLNRQVFRSTDYSRFATLFLGVLSPADGRLKYVNAGHNPPLVVAPDGSFAHLAPTGMPVGMLEEAEYRSGETTLAPGSSLVVFSDGIPEAMDAQEEQYGDERLERLLRDSAGRTAGEIRERILADVRGFRADEAPSDDLTLVLVKRAG